MGHALMSLFLCPLQVWLPCTNATGNKTQDIQGKGGLTELVDGDLTPPRTTVSTRVKVEVDELSWTTLNTVTTIVVWFAITVATVSFVLCARMSCVGTHWRKTLLSFF
jgi:hypothetical protein